MDALEAIRTRRSIRKYQERPVEDDVCSPPYIRAHVGLKEAIPAVLSGNLKAR